MSLDFGRFIKRWTVDQAVITLHGLFAGTDSGAPWLRTLYVAAVLLVGMLTVVRLLGHTGPTERRKAARAEA